MPNEIHGKLARIAGEIGAINKTERNKEQGFQFRSIEQITDKARPLLAQYRVSVMPRIISTEYSEVVAKSGARGFRCIAQVEYTFTAEDGSAAVCSMVGEAADYGDKATSKAVQMAYKYALTQVFSIGSGDDPDGISVDVGHEGTSRPRSGPQKRTPTVVDQLPGAVLDAPQSPVTAPPSDGNVAKGVGKLRADLVNRLGSPKEAAKVWQAALLNFGLTYSEEIPENMVEALETYLKGIGTPV